MENSIKTKRNKTKLIKKKTNTSIKNNLVKLNREFSKEERQITNKYFRTFLINLKIREMQMKSTQRIHLPLVRISIIKKTNENKCWWGYLH